MKKNNINKIYLSILGAFFVISITAIYGFSKTMFNNNMSLVFRQIAFYIVGFILIFLLLRFKGEKILKYSYLIYGINLILLILVLFLGEEINGAKAWFSIPLIGSFQPSEFMKIGIVLCLANIINNSKIETLKDEFILILKVLLVIIIPAIFTFLEPDTGAVIIYFIAGFFMLFMSKIRLRWFVLFFIILLLIGGIILYLFYFQSDFFVKIFGSSLFYRIDRITGWSTSSGMQLENSIISIGSSSFFGNGIDNVKLYFPEGQTDFIFTSFVTSFGLFGAIILLITILIFDFTMLRDIKNNSPLNKLIISGFLGIIIFQQFYNIAMTIGLVPIMGITLPFISYGGSSLISFMIILGIIMRLKNNKIKAIY